MEELFVAETKLEQILIERGMSQGDLMRLIKQKSGFKIGRDRISKITTGRMKNYSLETRSSKPNLCFAKLYIWHVPNPVKIYKTLFAILEQN